MELYTEQPAARIYCRETFGRENSLENDLRLKVWITLEELLSATTNASVVFGLD